jgi:tellurium resistance protein TerD
MQQQSYQQPAPAPRQRPQGSGVVLKKGQKVNLADNGQTLTRIKACLGWDVTNGACDLDVSAFLLGADGRVLGDDWFVFYGQTVSPDGSIQHSGDSSGEGVGDDEIITMNLPAVNPNVKKIVFVITINEAIELGLNFSMVQNAYVRVVDDSNGRELIRFTLTDYYANVTSMMVGEVYNHNGQWKFNAIGDGVAKDLAGLCEMYGVNVAG